MQDKDSYPITKEVISCAYYLWKEKNYSNVCTKWNKNNDSLLLFLSDYRLHTFFKGLEKKIPLKMKNFSWVEGLSEDLYKDLDIMIMSNLLWKVNDFYVCRPKLLSTFSEFSEGFSEIGESFIKDLACDDYGSRLFKIHLQISF